MPPCSGRCFLSSVRRGFGDTIASTRDGARDRLACTRSIRCNVRAIATRCGSRWRSCACRYELVEVDILKGETHTPDFLAKNPNGQIPLLEIEPGRYLAEFERDPVVPRRAQRTPARRSDRARRDPAMAVLRAARHRAEYRRRLFLAVPGERRTLAAAARDRRLDGGRPAHARRSWTSICRQSRFFAGERYTVADIALYAYTHVARAMRFRPVAVPGRARLARARRGRAAACADGSRMPAR